MVCRRANAANSSALDIGSGDVNTEAQSPQFLGERVSIFLWSEAQSISRQVPPLFPAPSVCVRHAGSHDTLLRKRLGESTGLSPYP
jgi:hypothetical protein